MKVNIEKMWWHLLGALPINPDVQKKKLKEIADKIDDGFELFYNIAESDREYSENEYEIKEVLQSIIEGVGMVAEYDDEGDLFLEAGNKKFIVYVATSGRPQEVEE